MVQQRVIIVQQLEHVLLLLCLPHDCQQNDCIGKKSSQRLCCDVGRGQLAVNYSLLNYPSEYFSIKTVFHKPSIFNRTILILHFDFCCECASSWELGKGTCSPLYPFSLVIWWYHLLYIYITYIYYLDQNISISAFSIIFH